MSVIDPACGVACNGTEGCGCEAAARVERRGPRIAAATAIAAVACTACCVLPIALPSVVLGVAGGALALLGRAHGWVTQLAVVIVMATWAWIGWQVVRQKRRLTTSTIALMLLATAMTAASAWPLLESLACALDTVTSVRRSG